MIGGAGGVAEDGYSDLDGARIGPPPDLPSLLLHNRIVYLGMPLVPAVTELIIAEVSTIVRAFTTIWTLSQWKCLGSVLAQSESSSSLDPLKS